MTKRLGKIWLAFIIIVFAAIVFAVLSFICFPEVNAYSAQVKCFDCSYFDIPLDEEAYEETESVEVSYDIYVTRRWNQVADISGSVTVDGVTASIVYWQGSEGNYYCFVEGTDGLKRNAVTFSNDFGTVMIKYNDGRFDQDEAQMWFGPAGSADELIQAMARFGLDYGNV